MRVGNNQEVVFSNGEELPVHSTEHNMLKLSVSSNKSIYTEDNKKLILYLSAERTHMHTTALWMLIIYLKLAQVNLAYIEIRTQCKHVMRCSWINFRHCADDEDFVNKAQLRWFQKDNIGETEIERMESKY